MKIKFFWTCLAVIMMLTASSGGQAEAGVTFSLNKSEVKADEEVEVTVTPSGISGFYAVKPDFGGLEFTGEHTGENFANETFVMMEAEAFTFKVNIPDDSEPGDTFTIGGLYWDDPEKKKSISSEEVTVIGGGDDKDCSGVSGGTADTDNCGNCVGGNTGKSPCVRDCNGDWGGTAYTDACDKCVGGNTGNTACSETSYIIFVLAEEGGTIAPSSEDYFFEVNEGENRTFSFTPDSGYEVADVMVDGVSVGSRSSYTFKNISDDHELYVDFRIADDPEAGYMADDTLWVRAVIRTAEKGPIEAVWQKGGEFPILRCIQIILMTDILTKAEPPHWRQDIFANIMKMAEVTW